MRIAIVDDDTQAQKALCADLTELLELPADIRTFGSGEDFLACFEPGAFHLVILDIFMGKLTGMDVARKIRETDQDVRLVFCTSSNEFASESYEVGACYYLHKPFGKDRLRAMINRLDLENAEKLRSLQLPDGQSMVLRDILYADFAAHCVTFHCKQNRNITVRMSFADAESLLCVYPYFFAPSKGIAVNFYEVTAQGPDTFRMSDGTVIPISRRKAKEVLEAYSSFRFAFLRRGGE